MHISAKDLAAIIPADFTLGVATAAFQIEGALTEDGRGPAGWDGFSAKEGTTVEAPCPAVACDPYHRHTRQVALLQPPGIAPSRFALSSPPVQPNASAPCHPPGLDLSDRPLTRPPPYSLR